MDDSEHQGDEPNRDLPQLEPTPGPRADPLFERQTDDAELAGHGFRARLHSDTPVHSPTATATALTRLVLAAGLPAAAVGAGGRAMGVAAGLVLILALVVFVLTGSVGLFLILRTEHGPHELHPGKDNNEHDDTHQQQADHQGRHNHRHIPNPGPRRPSKTAQPPR